MCDELGPVVEPDERRRSTAFGGESVEDTHDVVGVDRPVDFDGEGFTGELVDDVQQLQGARRATGAGSACRSPASPPCVRPSRLVASPTGHARSRTPAGTRAAGAPHRRSVAGRAAESSGAARRRGTLDVRRLRTGHAACSLLRACGSGTLLWSVKPGGVVFEEAEELAGNVALEGSA